jgi:hypothetical protein
VGDCVIDKINEIVNSKPGYKNNKNISSVANMLNSFKNSSSGEIKNSIIKDGKYMYNTPQEKADIINHLITNVPIVTKLEEKGLLVLEESTKRKVGISDDNVKFSIAGEHSRIANLSKLEKAKKMLENGKNIKDIQEATGWYKLKDDRWRYRIKGTPKLLKQPNELKTTQTLKDLVDFPELYQSYPFLESLQVLVETEASPKLKGSYGISSNTITLQYTQLEGPDDFLNVLGHEVQHAIQDFESFSNGTTPDSVYKEDHDEGRKALIGLRRAVMDNYKVTTLEEYNEALDQYFVDYAFPEGIKVKVLGKEKFYTKSKLLEWLSLPKDFFMGSKIEKYAYKLGEIEARDAGSIWNNIEVFPESLKYWEEKSWIEDERTKYRRLAYAQGTYNTETKVSTLYISHLNTNSVIPAFYHEVGVHAYLDVLSGKEAETLKNRAVSMYHSGLRSKNPEIERFFKQVQNRLVDSGAAHDPEEILAYIIEEGIKSSFKSTAKTLQERLKEVLPSALSSLIDKFITILDKKIKLLTDQEVLGEYIDIENVILAGVNKVREQAPVNSVKKVEEIIFDSFDSLSLLSKKECK